MNAEAKVVSGIGARERDPRPIVALPRSGLPGLAIGGISVVLAVLLFLVLNGRREAGEARSSTREGARAAEFAPPPPLTIPVDAPPYRQQAVLRPLPMVAVPAEPLRLRASPPAARLAAPVPRAGLAPAPERYAESYAESVRTYEDPAPRQPAIGDEQPALVLDSGSRASGAGTRQGDGAAGAGGASATAAGPGPVRLGKSIDPTTAMPAGTVIQAVLETPIDTAKPGLARAVVSRDARGFDGRQVLVPRGSRLTGEYQSDVRSGQKKVLINWTQLIRPDGSVIKLDSPAADGLGGAGIPGRSSGVPLGRLAQGVLRTALSIGTGVASWLGRGSVIVGVPGAELARAADGAPGGRGSRNRIKVRQGTMFNVFVARNLDFSAASPAP